MREKNKQQIQYDIENKSKRWRTIWAMVAVSDQLKIAMSALKRIKNQRGYAALEAPKMAERALRRITRIHAKAFPNKTGE